ncbi:hypothetical protein J6590_064103 [Homalodisca vitripennis]|nr:hypothetical protein J6590_064103 [Homalodisca vitripennis]
MVMAVNGFECLLNDPTRITADTATCIDHVFARVSRVDMMSVEADVEHAGITDHSLVRVCVGVCEAGDGGGGPASPAPAKANRTDYDKLNRLLVCADWADVYRQSDASSAFDSAVAKPIVGVGFLNRYDLVVDGEPRRLQ